MEEEQHNSHFDRLRRLLENPKGILFSQPDLIKNEPFYGSLSFEKREEIQKTITNNVSLMTFLEYKCHQAKENFEEEIKKLLAQEELELLNFSKPINLKEFSELTKIENELEQGENDIVRELENSINPRSVDKKLPSYVLIKDNSGVLSVLFLNNQTVHSVSQNSASSKLNTYCLSVDDTIQIRMNPLLHLLGKFYSKKLKEDLEKTCSKEDVKEIYVFGSFFSGALAEFTCLDMLINAVKSTQKSEQKSFLEKLWPRVITFNADPLYLEPYCEENRPKTSLSSSMLINAATTTIGTIVPAVQALGYMLPIAKTLSNVGSEIVSSKEKNLSYNIYNNVIGKDFWLRLLLPYEEMKETFFEHLLSEGKKLSNAFLVAPSTFGTPWTIDPHNHPGLFNKKTTSDNFSYEPTGVDPDNPVFKTIFGLLGINWENHCDYLQAIEQIEKTKVLESVGGMSKKLTVIDRTILEVFKKITIKQSFLNKIPFRTNSEPDIFMQEELKKKWGAVHVILDKESFVIGYVCDKNTIIKSKRIQIKEEKKEISGFEIISVLVNNPQKNAPKESSSITCYSWHFENEEITFTHPVMFSPNKSLTLGWPPFILAIKGLEAFG